MSRASHSPVGKQWDMDFCTPLAGKEPWDGKFRHLSEDCCPNKILNPMMKGIVFQHSSLDKY